MTEAAEVHVRMLAIDPQDSTNTRLLWEATGDPMECHYAGARWVRDAADADPERTDIYDRFLGRISTLADQPPPKSGVLVIINPPLKLLWSVTWPWAARSGRPS